MLHCYNIAKCYNSNVNSSRRLKLRVEQNWKPSLQLKPQHLQCIKIILFYIICNVPDVDTGPLMTTALQKAKNDITAMDWITTLCYVDILNKGKTALSGPLADPTIENIAKADKVVIPQASSGSHNTEAPVLPTHIAHLILFGINKELNFSETEQYFLFEHKLLPVLLTWLHLVYGKMLFYTKHSHLMVYVENYYI